MEEETKEQTTSNLVLEAQNAAQRLEEANAKKEELIKREEELEARRIIGGKSEGGTESPRKTDEELKKEAAIEFFKGTGIDKAIEKHG